MTVPKWLFVGLVLMQAHFVSSYLVPLDAEAQKTFGGLLRWAWPWSDGDSGPIGAVTVSSGVPFAGLLLAMTAAVALVMAGMAVVGIWVPQNWWRLLTMTGTVLSLALLVLFFGFTKLLPIAVGLTLVWFTVSNWSGAAWATAPGD